MTRPAGPGRLPIPELRLSNAQNIARAKGHRESLGRIKVRLGCADCGYNDLAEALEFDHRPGEVKLFNLSQAGGTPGLRSGLKSRNAMWSAPTATEYGPTVDGRN